MYIGQVYFRITKSLVQNSIDLTYSVMNLWQYRNWKSCSSVIWWSWWIYTICTCWTKTKVYVEKYLQTRCFCVFQTTLKWWIFWKKNKFCLISPVLFNKSNLQKLKAFKDDSPIGFNMNLFLVSTWFQKLVPKFARSTHISIKLHQLFSTSFHMLDSKWFCQFTCLPAKYIWQN